jgi:hypothetical protein
MSVHSTLVVALTTVGLLFWTGCQSSKSSGASGTSKAARNVSSVTSTPPGDRASMGAVIPAPPISAPTSVLAQLSAVAHAVEKAGSKAMWTAMSGTAMAITGNIGLTPSVITIKATDYPLTLVREIAARDLADASEIVSESQAATARLYKERVPEMCGSDGEAAWMLAL